MTSATRCRRQWRLAVLVVGAIALVTTACGPPPSGPAGYTPSPTDPITFGAGGVVGNDAATGAATTGDGVWTVFSSRATNLVVGDTNGRDDTFLRNNVTGAVTRVAESTVGEPRLTADGRYISYRKFSSPGYGTYNVFDRITSTTSTWASHGNLNTPIVSEDGTHAVYGAGSSFGIFAVYCRIRDLAAGTEIDCPPGGPGFGTVSLDGVSSNGRYVMYYWNDQDGGGTSGRFLYDIETATRTPLTGAFVSLGISNVVSDDGNWVLAGGFGPSVPLAIHDLAAGTSQPFPGLPDGVLAPVGISPSGRYFAVITDSTNLDPADTNGVADLYVYDRIEGTVSLASTVFDTGAVTPSGVARCGSIVGQVNDAGQVCVLAEDPMSPTDTNQFVDGYLTAPL